MLPIFFALSKNPRSHTFRNDARAAFTLPELLVVILIILVLAAVLIPVVASIRAKAGESRCMGLLKGMAVASAAFSVENGMYLPASMPRPGSTATRYTWASNPAFYEYFGLTGDGQGTPAWGFYPHEFLCPQAKQARRVTLMNNIMQSYGMNVEGLGPDRVGGQFVTQGFRTSVITRPSQKILFIDALTYNVNMNASDPAIYESLQGEENRPANPTTGIVAYRHKGRANAAFFDGSVRSLDGEEIKRNPKYWDVLAD